MSAQDKSNQIPITDAKESCLSPKRQRITKPKDEAENGECGEVRK